MKKLALIAALMLAGTANANAQSWKTSDVICLALSRMGEASAKARESNVAELDLLKLSRDGGAKTAAGQYAAASAELVVPFVYTMKLTPDQARQMVYLKCKAGEYDDGRVGVKP